MGQEEIERVKADLEVMKKAAGIERKYTLREVFISVIMGSVGLLLVFLDVFVFKSHDRRTSVMILGVVAIPVIFAIIIYNKHKNIKPQWLGWRFFWGMVIINTLFLCGFIACSEKYNMPTNDIVMGAIFIFGGLYTAIESFWRNRNFYGLTVAVPMMILGFLLPIYPSRIITMYGLAWAISSFAYAGVIAHVIHQQKVSNDAD